METEKKHLDSYLKWRVLPGVVAHTCRPTAQAAEAEGSKHQHQPEIQEPKANETAQWVTEYHCNHSYRKMGGRWRSESPRGSRTTWPEYVALQKHQETLP